MKAPQLHVIEPARKTEEEIEAEYAGEVYGIDPLWMIGGYEEQPVTAKLPVDVGLLVEIAYELDRRLASTGRRLKPGIRKRLIEVAYMACQRDGAVEPARLDELIAVAR